MAEKKTVKDLLEDEIKDLYSAEKQLTKAIPKMAKGSNDRTLQAAFEGHLKETEAQVVRLEEVAKLSTYRQPAKNASAWKAAYTKAPKLSKRKETKRFWI